jgi:hypothetical protein
MEHDGGYMTHKEGANALLGLRPVEEYYANPLTAGLYEIGYAQMVSRPALFMGIASNMA